MRILYIDIDSCRPDHFGCYGYHRNTSPAIDRLAAEGTRLTNYYCSDAPCLPSRTALYTGMFGIHNGVVGHGGTAADLRVEGPGRDFKDLVEMTCLPARLQQHGLKTVQISPFGQRHAARQFYAGFNEIHNTGGEGMESAEHVTPLVTKWIADNAAKDNWFLHVNYWDPHTPYRVPHDYPNHFANDPLPAWLTPDVLREHQRKVGPHSAQDLNMYDDGHDPRYPRAIGRLDTMEDLRTWMDGYDLGVRYADDQVATIVAQLRATGVFEDTLIIVTADHGENQGELGIYGEHGVADQFTCRVPFIARGPGVKRGLCDDGLHYHLDLAPTMADLLGFSPSARWDGRTFAPTLRQGTDTGRPFLVIGQCAHVCQRSVRFGPWLYLRTYHDGYHLFPKEMLFNLETDPHEQHNVAAENRSICDQAVRHLSDWHDDMMMTMSHDNDPLWTVMSEGGPAHARGKLDRYLPHLRQTGRADRIPELLLRHPKEKISRPAP